MYVTNLKNMKVGINGLINLRPSEVNRYIDNKDVDLVARVLQLKAAGLVSVVDAPGLTKTTSGRVIKALGVDKGAISNGPRTPVKQVKEEKKVEVVEQVAKKEEPKEEEEKVTVTAAGEQFAIGAETDLDNEAKAKRKNKKK